jgi:hypothetical protein
VRLLDAVGLVGVVLMLGAYVAAQMRRLDPLRPASLLINAAGASLVMISMIHAFNLAAFIMEASWAATALYGLARFYLTRDRRQP